MRSSCTQGLTQTVHNGHETALLEAKQIYGQINCSRSANACEIPVMLHMIFRQRGRRTACDRGKEADTLDRVMKRTCSGPSRPSDPDCTSMQNLTVLTSTRCLQAPVCSGVAPKTRMLPYPT